MEDREIIDLFLARNEAAVTESKNKYHRYLSYIASNVLSSPEDIEECESDVYFSAWSRIPPDEPGNLKLYLAKLMRCRAIDVLRSKNAVKRGGPDTVLSLDELMEAMPEQADPSAGNTVEEALEAKELGRLINDFLKELPETDRALFVRRYWFYDSIEDVAERFGFSVSKTKVRLFRIREKLREQLGREGYHL